MAREDGETATEGEDTSATAGPGGLSEAAREWVRRTVAEMEPLSQDEREYLAWMFHRQD